MVLRGTYGDKVHQAFRMTRQGVRWRFQRLFNEVYVNAFETILFIEKVFGPQLREHAVRISQERYTHHQQHRQAGSDRPAR
jgi:succinate dehydrogenase/fumarate reductase flavoprotein subunit